MKKIILFLAFLFFYASNVYAAFPILKNTVTVIDSIEQDNRGLDMSNSTCTNIITNNNNKLNILYQYGDGRRDWRRGEGMRAMFWAMWGLFFWPLGILAIIHGIRGLGSRSGREQDRALLGLIFGIGEVIACIVFLIFLFTFPFYFIII